MALYDFRGRISVDYRFMNDGTPIIQGTNMTADGELLFEFRDHLIPVYELTNTMGESFKTNTYVSFNITLDCANNADPGKELKVLIDIPNGFTLINHKSNEGTYSPNLNTWFVTLENQTATLNIILEPITVSSGTFTVELDGTEVIVETEYTIASSDSDGTIASHEIQLSNPPESYAGAVGGGEDGTTTGYTTVNNVTYTNLLDLDVAECSNAAKFHKNQGTETIVDWTSVTYAERKGKSVIVSCPGTNNDEGTYITYSGLTIGEEYTVPICAYALAGTELAAYVVGTDGYVVFSPGGAMYEKRLKFIATATTHDLVIHLTSKIAADFSVALLMVAEGDIGNAPIVLPGETGNTVKVTNVEEVTDQMRVVYSGYGMEFADEDIDELVSIGTTDFIHLAYYNITDGYTAKKAVIDDYATRFKNKGIRYHVGCAAFIHANETQEDPTNTTYVNSLISTIEDLITDCTDVAGISFDDFNYPSTYHNNANEATEELTLKNFITSVTTAVHAIRSSAKVSGALMPVPGEQGNNLTYFSDEFDFSILMCTYRFKNNVSTFIRDRLEATFEYTGDNLVIPAILNFYSDSDPNNYWPVEQLISDLYDILELNPAGYAIFDWDRHPQGLFCPVENANSGNNSIRIRTYGASPNEGVKLSIPDIQLRDDFNGVLAIKTLDDFEYNAGFGVNKLEPLIGIGDWEEVNLSQTASEKYLYVETEGTTKTVFYLDEFTFSLGLSGTYETFISNLKDGELYTIITYAKVDEPSVTGIHAGVKNNRLSIINGTEYLGERVSLQNNIEKLVCSFIYDSTHDITIRRYYEYQSVTTTFTNRFYGLCINEGLNTEYSESQNLLLNPESLFDDTSYSELELPGNSQSAEYIFEFEPSTTNANKFFSGILLGLNSFAQIASGIEVKITTDETESDTKSTFINVTGEINLGDLTDLWGINETYLRNKTFYVHVIFKNTTLNQQVFSYSNLKTVLYYTTDLVGDSHTVIYNDEHGKLYGLALYKDNNPEGPNYNLQTVNMDMSDGEFAVKFNIKSKELQIDFRIYGDTLEESQMRLRAIRKWFANERNAVNQPVLNSLIFTYDLTREYFVIFKDVIEVEKEITSLICTAKFYVPSGVARATEYLVTGAVGQNPGEIKVYPLIEVKSDGSSQLVITENDTQCTITLNDPPSANTTLYFDCESRTVEDEAGNDYSTDLAINSRWINFGAKANYNISVDGGVLQQVSFKPGY